MASQALKTTNIKGRQYIEVNERLKYFREHFKGYALETELVKVDADTALMRALIRDPDGKLVATGTAFERKDNPSSIVNKTSHVENCETSAWGRALGNFGIGIDASVASADEVQNAILNQEKSGPEKKAAPAKAPPSVIKVLEALNDCQDEPKLTKVYNRAMDFRWNQDEAEKITHCYLAGIVHLTHWTLEEGTFYNTSDVPMAQVTRPDAAGYRIVVDRNSPVEA